MNKQTEQNKIIAACGNDCAVCPRYIKEPYSKTAKQLAHTAEFWYKIGYRDRFVSKFVQGMNMR